jgi:hypothetical protein
VNLPRPESGDRKPERGELPRGSAASGVGFGLQAHARKGKAGSYQIKVNQTELPTKRGAEVESKIGGRESNEEGRG